MAEPSLIEIFDLCIERLAAGETVEDCLKDYPDSAEELRGMLETGALIFQAQANTDDEKQAQAHTRTRIEAALQTDFAPRKGKNSMFTLRRSVIWVGGAAAAIFAFTFGFAFAMTSQESPPVGVVANAALPDFDNDGLANDLEITYGTDPNTADTDGDGLIDGDEVRVWATNPLLQDTDYDGWSDGDEVNTRGTNPTSREIAATATVVPAIVTVNAMMTATNSSEEQAFILTATQYVLEITQTAEEAFTATAFKGFATETAFEGFATPTAPLIFLTATPAPTATRGLSLPTEVAPIIVPTSAIVTDLDGADTAISGDVVSTSVAGYVAMTPTFAPPASSTEKDKDVTGSGDGKPLLAEPERDRTDADTDEYRSEDGRTLADGTLAIASGAGGGDGAEAPVAPPDVLVEATVVASYGTTGSEINASIVLSQQQLNPMKAGEIDDNAEWDTYMEFRHNFENTYGTYGIINLDVSGRRIIKIVDAAGKPILGARVAVSAPNFSVETRTYATGMTLFFPNADESTKRRDEFQVIVSYDQYQAYYTLDLRKVGDIVEIQMPIVILRDGTVSADINLNAPVSVITTGNTSNDMIPPPVDVYPATPTPAASLDLIAPSATFTPTPAGNAVTPTFPVMQAT